MYRDVVGGFAFLAAVSLAVPVWADAGKGKIEGKKDFDKHCGACHAAGGNSARPEKTLKKKDLQANGIRTVSDIVKLMRKPGPGMTPFDRKAIDDRKAKAIAEYVLKTF